MLEMRPNLKYPSIVFLSIFLHIKCHLLITSTAYIHIMTANTMTPYQTAPTIAAFSMALCLAVYATKLNKQMREQRTIVMNMRVIQ